MQDGIRRLDKVGAVFEPDDRDVCPSGNLVSLLGILFALFDIEHVVLHLECIKQRL